MLLHLEFAEPLSESECGHSSGGSQAVSNGHHLRQLHPSYSLRQTPAMHRRRKCEGEYWQLIKMRALGRRSRTKPEKEREKLTYRGRGRRPCCTGLVCMTHE